MNRAPTADETGKVLLELRGVKRDYHQGETVISVLSDAHLQIRGGELTALVGPSGSGKSTLLNIAGLLERPTDGEVIIAGHPTSAWQPAARQAARQPYRLCFPVSPAVAGILGCRKCDGAADAERAGAG